MASAADEDLAATKTDGFKVGEKKTVEEYAKLGKLSLCCVGSTVQLSVTTGNALCLVILILQFYPLTMTLLVCGSFTWPSDRFLVSRYRQSPFS